MPERDPASCSLPAGLSGAGLQVIGVALDKARKARNVVRTLRINYPVLVADPKSDQGLLRLWGDAQQVLPYSVVIGRDGHIHFTQVGIMDEETFTIMCSRCSGLCD